MNKGCLLPAVCVSLVWAAAADANQEAPPKDTARSAYDEALARAKKEGKYFVVVLYGKDCPDCDRLDKTLSSADVQDWMTRRGVLLKLNGGESTGANFIAAHNVGKFPAVVLMSSGARELGRHHGYVKPKRLVAILDEFTQSDRIRGAGGLNPWAGQDVILSTVDRAESLTRSGEYDNALKELIWCFEHRAARSPVFVIRGLPKLVNALVELGKHHEPAKQELMARLSRAEEETLRKGRPSTFSLYLIKYGYLALEDEESIVAHYDRMKRVQAKGVGVRDFARIIYGPLLKARRYEDLRYSVNDPQETEMFFDSARRAGHDRNEIRSLMASRYEVLLALGKNADAALLAERLLRTDKSKRTHMALAEAALRSGQPTDADITYARKVYMATDAKDARSVIVLAKLLALKTPKSPDAIQILRTGMNIAKSPEDRSALALCLREVRSGKVEPTLPPAKMVKKKRRE